MDTASPWLIVGLGNIGTKYEKTWHNAGFIAIDYISQKFNIKIDRIKFKGVYGQGVIGGEKVVLLKPSTYMNNSGESVREASTFFKVPSERILLIYDDIDINRGTIKIRLSGSAGTHNGMRSVISHLNTQAFPRFRIGIGPLPEKWAIVDFVLSEIGPDDQKSVFESIEKTCAAIEIFMTKGVEKAMNLYSGKENTTPKTNQSQKPNSPQNESQVQKTNSPQNESQGQKTNSSQKEKDK